MRRSSLWARGARICNGRAIRAGTLLILSRAIAIIRLFFLLVRTVSYQLSCFVWGWPGTHGIGMFGPENENQEAQNQRSSLRFQRPGLPRYRRCSAESQPLRSHGRRTSYSSNSQESSLSCGLDSVWAVSLSELTG